MKFIGAVAFLTALLSTDSAVAFTPLQSSRSRSTRAASSLAALSPPDRIKRAGGGIPLEPPGNKHLFDPATDGKLQGTGSLDDRISRGTQYEYLAPVPPPTVPEALDDAQHWLEDIGSPPPVFAKATQPAIARVLGRARKLSLRCDLGGPCGFRTRPT